MLGGLDCGEVDWDEIRELAIESYCLNAPKRLAAQVARQLNQTVHIVRADTTVDPRHSNPADVRQFGNPDC